MNRSMLEKLKLKTNIRIGGKGTIRRKIKKQRIVKKQNKITVFQKQYNLMVNRINNYVNKLDTKEDSYNLIYKNIVDFFQNKIKRKDYVKKKVIENYLDFINVYLLNPDKLLLNNYDTLIKYITNDGVNRLNDCLFETWDNLNNLNN